MKKDKAEKYLPDFNGGNINYSLDNISRVLSVLGNPQTGMDYIHVVGTNGKGSTCAFISSILAAEGYRVGRFTSPFLADERECIDIGGRKISPKAFNELAKRVGLASGEAGVMLTGFETLAAIALMYFKSCKCDVSVIEAGMGGRKDATNVIDAGLSVITGISLDHMEYLGSSLAEITFEKASVLKKGGLLVANVEREDLKKVVKNTALINRAAGVVFVAEAVSARLLSSEPDGIGFHACLPSFGDKNFNTGLAGEYQFENAKTALCAIDILNSTGKFKVSAEAAVSGIKKARWPARFEVIKRLGRTFVVDGAHNVEGVDAFIKSFRKLFPGRKARLITGILKNKEYKTMLDMLSEISDGIALCDFESRGEKNSARHLYDHLASKIKGLRVFEHYAQALEWGVASSGRGGLICLTGSLYLAGPAGRYLKSSQFNSGMHGGL